MEGENEASALAWCWVIEALSSFTQIFNSTLLDLIDAAPVWHDRFSETTKELVALRCLEKLSTNVVDPGASSALDSRAGFDFSRSCQDVLQETLVKMPSELRRDGAKLFKWDVHQFIEHKRAGIFKCHLHQLRESILEGTHPHTDYLKERSGLLPRNSSYTGLVNDGKHDSENRCTASKLRQLLVTVSDGYHIEKNHLEAIRHEFLSAHCTFDQDFPAMTESTEQNLCMKCNEGGELLACKTTTCPLMVHKSCVDASSLLDAESDFFCPFCVYSRAISEYLESEKKAYLARKEFAIFIGKDMQN